MGRGVADSFSALQRAENSSIGRGFLAHIHPLTFQCSSASRKFLNLPVQVFTTTVASVSVLFSEPKIPQSACAVCMILLTRRVSVLFSEPKIPQSRGGTSATTSIIRFSALQRAENSSIAAFGCPGDRVGEFQCSSASRKFLNLRRCMGAVGSCAGFSALQRAENSSIRAFV